MNPSPVDLSRTVRPKWINESYPEAAGPRSSEYERHRWLSRALAERRLATAAFQEQTLKEHYSALLTCAVNSKTLPDGIQIVEVLSDGLGLLEPHWHAVRAGDATITCFDDRDMEKYGKDIARFRARARETDTLGAYPRHRDMGRRLADSVVFLVTDQGQVLAYCPDRQAWIDVSEEGSIRDLLVLNDEKEEQQRLALRRSLFALSEQTLWPAFFKEKEGQRLSLVLVATTPHSSFGSVWALHLLLPERLPIQSDETRHELLVRLTRTPESCLRDAWSLSHLRDFSGGIRLEAVRLFRKFTGRRPEPQPTDVVPYSNSDIRLYESLDGMGPEATFGRAFDAACLDQSNFDHLPTATNPQMEKLFQGARSWAIGIALSRRGRREEAEAFQALARERIESVAGPEALKDSRIVWEKARESVGIGDDSYNLILDVAFRIVGRYDQNSR